MGRGFAILSISNILVKVLSLFFVPILRVLLGGSSAYGVYSVSNTVFAFVYVLEIISLYHSAPTAYVLYAQCCPGSPCISPVHHPIVSYGMPDNILEIALPKSHAHPMTTDLALCLQPHDDLLALIHQCGYQQAQQPSCH